MSYLDDFQHPDETRFVNEVNARRAAVTDDALGQDVFQTLLAVSYARFMLNSTRNLIDHVYGTGPSFVPRRKNDTNQ